MLHDVIGSEPDGVDPPRVARPRRPPPPTRFAALAGLVAGALAVTVGMLAASITDRLREEVARHAH